MVLRSTVFAITETLLGSPSIVDPVLAWHYSGRSYLLAVGTTTPVCPQEGSQEEGRVKSEEGRGGSEGEGVRVSFGENQAARPTVRAGRIVIWRMGTRPTSCPAIRRVGMVSL